MEGKELRIGNYLHDRNGNLCKVIELRQDGIYAPAIDKATTGLPNKPIELTKEWFEKFNLNHNDRLHSANEEIKKESAKDVGVRYVSYFFNERIGKWMDCQTRIVFDYVHQVQNHYYVMTGEELTIKS
ncbi:MULTISPECIES: hypothetical protein [Elizabethkingia]|uniref:hypothetical protein n=1 Tax=Elizabethkingia TaxID=308865 RepID=UPI0021A83CE0|nr:MULTISPECIES: hypothetical protein [Elizabethkingia]MCT3689556.1 hypothetical protein [Elizabethkingia anophelis]MCT3706356.1 hypothetical protein [Elizabethkingia anophelis]MCT3713374.1 hypothetical protein [Elizabethkingia anophelis]MCT3716792.1 hypothetical protein [Elizabethkingia anophelis]MCT3730449.1 hypothetical protein [Elizabethkingia anophelis]